MVVLDLIRKDLKPGDGMEGSDKKAKRNVVYAINGVAKKNMDSKVGSRGMVMMEIEQKTKTTNPDKNHSFDLCFSPEKDQLG